MKLASLRLIPALCAPALLCGQSNPRQVQPERPTVATHAGTVAPGCLEIESGIQIDHVAASSDGLSLPTAFKIGLAGNAQLSIFASLVRPPAESSVGFGDLGIGVKWRLIDDAPVLGRFAVLPSVKLPTGSTTTGAGTGTTDESLLVISSHTFGPISMDANASITRRSGSGASVPKTATLATLSFGGPLVGRAGWAAEVFTYPGTSGPAGASTTVSALFGPTLSVSDELALDTGVILPIKGTSPRYSLYAGGVVNVGRLFR